MAEDCFVNAFTVFSGRPAASCSLDAALQIHESVVITVLPQVQLNSLKPLAVVENGLGRPQHRL